MATMQLMSSHYWITERSTYKFPPIELRDESGALINPATVTLTWYDTTTPAYAIVNSLQDVDVKTGRGRVTGGVLALTLTPDDTVLLQPNRTHETRIALIQFTYGSGGTKAGAFEVQCVVRSVRYRP